MIENIENIKKKLDVHLSSEQYLSAQKLVIEELQKAVEGHRLDLSKKIPPTLTHYTSLETVYSMLKNTQHRISGTEGVAPDDTKGTVAKPQRQIWSGLRLYESCSLNDPAEGTYLLNKIKEKHKWIDNAGPHNNAFICSFVGPGNQGDTIKAGDNLVHWKTYGRDGLGCSISYPIEGYANLYCPVQYGKKSVNNFIKKFKPYLKMGDVICKMLKGNNEGIKEFATKFRDVLDHIRFLYKSKAYRHENECRFIEIEKIESGKLNYHFKSSSNYVRAYIEVPELSIDQILMSGSKVCIGPRVVNKEILCANLKNFATQKELYGPTFIPSEISYRKIW